MVKAVGEFAKKCKLDKEFAKSMAKIIIVSKKKQKDKMIEASVLSALKTLISLAFPLFKAQYVTTIVKIAVEGSPLPLIDLLKSI